MYHTARMYYAISFIITLFRREFRQFSQSCRNASTGNSPNWHTPVTGFPRRRDNVASSTDVSRHLNRYHERNCLPRTRNRDEKTYKTKGEHKDAKLRNDEKNSTREPTFIFVSQSFIFEKIAIDFEKTSGLDF